MDMKAVGFGSLVALLVAAVALLTAPAAVAKDGDILRVGSCTKSSSSKIKLSEENGRIEVEFEVDQNRNGVRWNVRIAKNGSRIARMTRVTRGPSGSFEARILARNSAGPDRFVATATRAGETCTARATF
jgi:hypothetical protein